MINCILPYVNLIQCSKANGLRVYLITNYSHCEVYLQSKQMSTFSVGENRPNEIEKTTSNNPSIMGVWEGFMQAKYMASPL